MKIYIDIPMKGNSPVRLATIAIALATVLALLASAAYALTRPGNTDEVSAGLSLSDALNANDARFKSVTAPRRFVFPDDHGPHPDYALEWWYYTGNLHTVEGRRFGYELTFFRIGLTVDESPRASKWASRQMYSAHFALTDVEGDAFHHFARYSRDALGLAGAVASPFRVWIEDWSVAANGDDTLPMRLRAAQEGVEIDLVLNGEKGIVLHGEGGFSRKGNGIGEASYYYSMTRLPTVGAITLDGKSYAVNGLSWLDREWSSTQLPDEHVGWDWFAIQLTDGRDIMYGVLRPADDNGSPFELGTIVAANGEYKSIQPGEVHLEVLAQWQSPRGGTYPSRWRFQMPSEGLNIEITPYISDQELHTAVRYWEGAVRIEGTSRGEPVDGSGYVELTGYAD